MLSHARQLRRALALIADTRGGCPAAVLLARDFTAEFIAALLASGVAEAQTESAARGGHAHHIHRLRITQAGRRLLMGRY